MSKAFILIAGARLPQDVWSTLRPTLSDQHLQALSTLVAPAKDQALQDLGPVSHQRATHRVWLWRVLTQRTGTPHEAPWLWLSLGGRQLSQEMWVLSLLPLNDNKEVESLAPSLDDGRFFEISSHIDPLLRAAGWQLQLWDNNWFLTRRNDFDAVSTPASALVGKRPSREDLFGRQADELWGLLEALNGALPPEISSSYTFWIWGGGKEELFFPPTKVRALAANDPISLGWANASGILTQYLTSTEKGWPLDTPPGDVIALIDTLYEPWLRHDWTTWLSRLPQVAEQVAAFRQQAQMREDTDILTVCFGVGNTASRLEKSTDHFFSRFWPRDKVDPVEWLTDMSHD